MELILIAENKLKVMLSPEDMASYSLTCDSIDYDNTETRRAFWSIFDEAKHRTGFDAALSRVFIQVYPSKNGGCELYVTRLGQSGGGDDCGGVSCRVRREPEAMCAFYAFGSIKELLEACRQLKANSYSGKSSAYVSDIGEPVCYLSLTDAPHFICEYGRPRCAENVMPYIHEHCSPICTSDAVNILSALA